MPKVPKNSGFQKLVEDIGRLYTGARQAQVQFAWETGRRIVQEEQKGEIRAAYGSALIRQLSAALMKKHGAGFSASNLRKMRQFYLSHQKHSAPSELDWTAYVELLPVKDAKTRRQIERCALKDGLNSRQIRFLIRNRQNPKGALSADAANPRLLSSSIKSQVFLKPPTNLTLNTFALSPWQAALPAGFVLVDCGFFVGWPVKKETLGDIDIRQEMSYAYAATVERVVDGDTLMVLVDVGFGIIVRERLRLRGINCPETTAPAGMRAKQYAEKLLPPGTRIVIKSHKNKKDIYGRFVVDVFYRTGAKHAPSILSAPVYLNQRLLDTGHAQRLDM